MNLKPLRRFVLSTTRRSGAQRLFRLGSRGPIVLFYHGVEEHFVDGQVQALHLPLSIFEKQIAFLRKNREVLSIDDLSQCIDNGWHLDSRHVVLTFDDGYKNNAQVVAPLLNAWKLPFTVFVSTKLIAEGRRIPSYYIRTALLYTQRKWVQVLSTGQAFDLTTRAQRTQAAAMVIAKMKKSPHYLVEQIVSECQELLSERTWAELNAVFSSEQPMNWLDVDHIRNMGATIGSHCHDHCILSSHQDEKHTLRQLQQSKSIIEERVGPCWYLAYPNGKAEDVSSAAYFYAKSTGFRLAFTTVPGEITPEIDCHFAPRIFGVLEHEEFCYALNRTAKQNEVYRSARATGSSQALAISLRANASSCNESKAQTIP